MRLSISCVTRARHRAETPEIPRFILPQLLGLIMLLHPAIAAAWGNTGHKLVARVAEAHLSTSARAKVRSLLKTDPAGKTLAAVAVWADDVKRDPRDGLKDTKQWHFVDMPRAETAYDAGRDCKDTDEGDCVIRALERERAILADAHANNARRRDALKFIVHLIGDLHQPLHCSDDQDRGGNDKQVMFNGFQSNLHRVWDTDMINAAAIADHLTQDGYTKRLLKGLPSDVSSLQSGTVEDWALESHKLADSNAYDIPPATGNPKLHRLKTAYFKANRPIVEDQLAKAGVRLAKVLNEILQ